MDIAPNIYYSINTGGDAATLAAFPGPVSSGKKYILE
jgi:hypothetical protein